MRFFLALILGFFFISCKNKHDSITVVNNSNEDLVFDYFEDGDRDSQKSEKPVYTAYYVNWYKKRKVKKQQQLTRMDDIFVDVSYEKLINELPKKHIELYGFNIDTLNKYAKGYTINYLIENKLYYKKIKLTIDTLNELKWTVTIK